MYVCVYLSVSVSVFVYEYYGLKQNLPTLGSSSYLFHSYVSLPYLISYLPYLISYLITYLSFIFSSRDNEFFWFMPIYGNPQGFLETARAHYFSQDPVCPPASVPLLKHFNSKNSSSRGKKSGSRSSGSNRSQGGSIGSNGPSGKSSRSSSGGSSDSLVSCGSNSEEDVDASEDPERGERDRKARVDREGAMDCREGGREDEVDGALIEAKIGFNSFLLSSPSKAPKGPSASSGSSNVTLRASGVSAKEGRDGRTGDGKEGKEGRVEGGREREGSYTLTSAFSTTRRNE